MFGLIPHSFLSFIKQIFENLCDSCLFNVYFSLSDAFRSSREFFTHMETLPLPVKDCKIWRTFGSRGHLSVMRAPLVKIYEHATHRRYCDKEHPFSKLYPGTV